MDKKSLLQLTLRLADHNFILGHRLSEWCGHGPILEEDIALANIALDKLGTARALYAYAAEVEGQGKSEDHYAFFRNEREFMNALLVEQPNGDYAMTMLREYLNDAYDTLYYQALVNSKDATLAGIAAKSVKELHYHLRHAREWVLRFGQGTEESHERAQQALNALWSYTGERFKDDEVDQQAAKEGWHVLPSSLEVEWKKQVVSTFEEAGLKIPEDAYMHQGGKKGIHTEHLGFILAQCQYLPRTIPEAQW